MKNGSDPVRLAYIGSLVPRDQLARYPDYSPAGMLFQSRLLTSLARAGIEISHVFSVRPARSYPGSPYLLLGPERSRLDEGVDGTQLPFLNLGVLKTVTLALSIFIHLLAWGWRERHAPNRVVLQYNLARPPAIASLLAARLLRARIFAVVADIEVPGSGPVPDTFLRRLDFRLQTGTLPLFDGLIVLTRRMAQDFAPRVPAIQMEGAVPEELARLLEEEGPGPEGQQEGECILMYAGSLSELKGIPLLLDAFRKLEGEQYRLWITGQGSCQPQVEEAARSDARITYWGFMEYSQVLELYRRATVLVNPHSTRLLTANYLFPSKLVEYLATGRPVISTSTPEVAEEYGHLAFILQEESAERMARLIERVAAMPRAEREARARAARAYIMEEKSWDRQGRRIADFLRRQSDLS